MAIRPKLSKIISGRTLLITALTVLVFLLVLSYYSRSRNLTKSYSAPIVENVSTLKKQEVISGLPIRLKIPVINVDSAILSVGVTSLGAMAVPERPEDTAWFNLGPRPGENGTAVIDGHYGWKKNVQAVFDSLHKLQLGDKIYVADKEGTTIVFIVREIRSYDLNVDASDVFESSDGKAHLNLVTCEGVWDKVSQSYSNRLVVFADKTE